MEEYRAKSDYIVIAAADGTPLDRLAVEGRTLEFRRGLIPATIHFGPDQNRSYEAGLKHRTYAAEAKQISIAHPKFGDETRPSFQRAMIDGSEVWVDVGLTSYPAFMSDLQRRRDNPAANDALQQLGLTHFNDKWAYLQQALGTLGLVITKDGKVVIGIRRTTGREYDGHMDSAASYVLFPPADVEHPEVIDPAQDAKRIIKREFGIPAEAIKSLIPVGFHGHPNTGEFDIAHIAHVDLTKEDHFAPGKYPKDAERKLEDLVFIEGFRGVQRVLKGEDMASEKFMYSTWGALLSLKPEDFEKNI